MGFIRNGAGNVQTSPENLGVIYEKANEKPAITYPDWIFTKATGTDIYLFLVETKKENTDHDKED